MTTRGDIIRILNEHSEEGREAKRAAVVIYLNANVLTEEEREKILGDLESYSEY